MDPVEYRLTRTITGDDGTIGKFSGPDFSAFSIELPWRNNDRQISCIPQGRYLCRIYNSPKHGHVYLLNDVPNHDFVEIHAANYGGDRKLGYKCDLLGCIGLGDTMAATTVNGLTQRMVTNSRATIARFMAELNNRDFYLTITGVVG